ncbi:MAG: LytTR family transcriptional regulator DNA-binding domain-containing protein [Ruminococcus sp.]|nr:LytTR family transcriptional regulator DNA-binding domain-containing protein [Ruminococcus sp.]
MSQDSIMYCEAYGKSTQIYLLKGNTLDSQISIGKLSKMLNREFISCHRSYLVSLRYIQSIGKTEITLDNGIKVPLSRRMYREVNKKFIKYYTKEYP